MNSQFLSLFRRLSTTRRCLKPYLSQEYKSQDLWNERFCCKTLTGNEETISTINLKIMRNQDLNNLELDTFVNNAAPSLEDTAQLREAARLIKAFRRTLYAHVLLPSTSQALCRLFLDSERLESLARVLDRRVDYGIFPDFFSYNLIIERAIDLDKFALAAKLASLVMLQEEFGQNPITDRLSLFALAKYIESKTDFTDWIDSDFAGDPIFSNELDQVPTDAKNESANEKAESNEIDDEDEDDVEYVRVPFLKNPYFDNHFDLKNPRIICGKSLSMVSQFIHGSPALKESSNILGLVLQGKWAEASKCLDHCSKSETEIGSIKDAALHYISNLNDLELPEELRNALSKKLECIPHSSSTLSELFKSSLLNDKLVDFERDDIKALKQEFLRSAEERTIIKNKYEERIHRQKIIEAIQAKREELKFKEQYLYFYDNLKKSRVTRIDYD